MGSKVKQALSVVVGIVALFVPGLQGVGLKLLAVGLGASGLRDQQKELEKRLQQDRDRVRGQTMTVKGGDGHSAVTGYGETICGGVIVDQRVINDEANGVHDLYVLIAHGFRKGGIEGLSGFFIGDSYVEWPGGWRDGAPSGRYQPRNWGFRFSTAAGDGAVIMRFADGSQTSTTLTGDGNFHFPELFADWGNEDIGRDIVFSEWIFKLRGGDEAGNTTNLFNGGVPNIRAVLKWNKVYDPRKDSTRTMAKDGFVGNGAHRLNDRATWEWSDNPALCVLDYIYEYSHLRVRLANGDRDDSRINWLTFKESADHCDGMVAVPSGMTTAMEKRYRMDILVDIGHSISHQQNLQAMLSTFATDLFRSGDKWLLSIPKARTATLSFTQADVFDEYELSSNAAINARFNRVGGRIISRDDTWSEIDVPSQERAQDIARDGLIEQDLPGNGITRHFQMQRLAALALARQPHQETWAGVLSWKAAELQPDDTFNLTLPELGNVVKKFRVDSITLQHPQGPVAITATEDEDDIYDDLASTGYHTFDSAGDITFAEPKPFAPTGLQAEGNVGNILWKWTNPPGYDVIVLYTSPTPNWDDATEAWRGKSNQHQQWFNTSTTRYGWVRAVGENGLFSDRHPNDDVSSVTATSLELSNVLRGTLVAGCPPSGAGSVGNVFVAPDGSSFEKGVDLWDGTSPLGRLWSESDVAFTLNTTTFALESTTIGDSGATPYLTGTARFSGAADRTPLSQIEFDIYDNSATAGTEWAADNPNAIAFRSPAVAGLDGSQRLATLTRTNPAAGDSNRYRFSGAIRDASLLRFIGNLVQVPSVTRPVTKNSRYVHIPFGPGGGTTHELPEDWVVGSPASTNVLFARIFADGRIEIRMVSGVELVDRLEVDLRFIFRRRATGNLTLSVPGPNADENHTQDSTGRTYQWTPHDPAMVTTVQDFYNAVSTGELIDVCMYDDGAETPLDAALADANERCEDNVASPWLKIGDGVTVNQASVERTIWQIKSKTQDADPAPNGVAMNVTTLRLTNLGANWVDREPTSWNSETQKVFCRVGVFPIENVSAENTVGISSEGWSAARVCEDGDTLGYIFIKRDVENASSIPVPADGTAFPPTIRIGSSNVATYDAPGDIPSDATGRIFQMPFHRSFGSKVYTYDDAWELYSGADGITIEVLPQQVTFQTNSPRPTTVADWGPATQRQIIRFRVFGEVEAELFFDRDMVDPDVPANLLGPGTDATDAAVTRTLETKIVRGRPGELALLGVGLLNTQAALVANKDADGIGRNYRGAGYRIRPDGGELPSDFTRIDLTARANDTRATAGVRQTLGTRPAGWRTGDVDRLLYFDALSTFDPDTPDRDIVVTYRNNTAIAQGLAVAPNINAMIDEALKIAATASEFVWSSGASVNRVLFTSSGGADGAKSFATTSGAFPTGLTMDDSGRVSGRAPTVLGTFESGSVSVRVTDANDQTAEVTVPWRVVPLPVSSGGGSGGGSVGGGGGGGTQATTAPFTFVGKTFELQVGQQKDFTFPGAQGGDTNEDVTYVLADEAEVDASLRLRFSGPRKELSINPRTAGSYTVRVKATRGDDTLTATMTFAISQLMTAPGQVPSLTPTLSRSADGTTGTLTVSWPQVAGATSYLLRVVAYRGTVPYQVLVGNLQTGSDVGNPAGSVKRWVSGSHSINSATRYFIRIWAKNSNGTGPSRTLAPWIPPSA